MNLKKILISFFFLVFISLGIIAGGAYWGFQKINNYANSPMTISEAQEFNVKAGISTRALIKELSSQGLIDFDWRTKGLLKLHPELAKIKTGLYEIDKGESLNEFLAKVIQGKQKTFSVTLIEGKTLKEWMQVLEKQPHLKLEKNVFEKVLTDQGDNGKPEGKFYPDTFHYTADKSSDEILMQSYQMMQQELQTIWENRAKDLPLKSSYELLILASIVEKETGLKSERELVAAVFINRLRKGMRLQTDPTVIYGMGDRFNGNITRRDLREKTPYNTYRINGLPPTPIASASKASLLAAAHPADVSYLYFVSKNDGSHVFSNSLKEHNRAVNKYQRNK